MPLNGRKLLAVTARFKRLINQSEFGEAVAVALKLVENGAQIININMQAMKNGLIDGVKATKKVIQLISAEPTLRATRS